MATTERPLTPKQRRFVAEYLKDQNATQAAKRAGYSKKHADVVGPRLLGYVGIRKIIDLKLQKIDDEVMIDKAFVLGGLKDIALRCRQARPVMVFDKEEKCMIQATAMNEKGEEVGLWEFDSTGANRSLELLGKHLKLFTEKHELSADESIEKLLGLSHGEKAA